MCRLTLSRGSMATTKNGWKNHEHQQTATKIMAHTGLSTVKRLAIDQLLSVISHENSSVNKFVFVCASLLVNWINFELFPFVALSQQIDFHTQEFYCSCGTHAMFRYFDIFFPHLIYTFQWQCNWADDKKKTKRKKKLFNTHISRMKNCSKIQIPI